MYLNRITLIGFLGSDAEKKVSHTTNIAVFSLATQTSWKNDAGGWESRTEWHRCVAFGKLADFAGNLAKGDTEEAARGRCVAAIQEACDHAAKYGIYLALENHGGIVATAEQMLAVVKAVQHDWFGVNFDTGNFRTEDPYADLAKIAPYAVVVQIKTEIHPQGKDKQPADLKRLLDILRAAHFRGYVALEYEAAEDPRTAVPKAIAELQKLI